MGALPFFFSVEHMALGDGGAHQFLGEGAWDARGSTAGYGAINDPGLGRAVAMASHASEVFLRREVPAGTEFTVGFRFRQNDTGTVANDIFQFRNSSGAVILNLHRNSSRLLQVRRGGTVLGTSTTELSTNSLYVEFAVKLDDTVGEFELRINGAVEASDSSVNTANAAGDCTAVQLQGAGTGSISNRQTRYRDIYVRSGRTFYGPIVLFPLWPTADVTAEWAPDTGSDNFARVADTSGSDEDTSYVETTDLDDLDEYTLENLPSGVNSVIAVVPTAVSIAPAGGAPQIELGIRTAAGTAVGDEVTVGVGAYATQISPLLERPGGGGWSIAAVNEAILRVRSA